MPSNSSHLQIGALRWGTLPGQGKQQPVYKGSLEGHTDWVNDVAVLGDRVLSCSNDRTVRVWNGATGERGSGVYAGMRLGDGKTASSAVSAPRSLLSVPGLERTMPKCMILQVFLAVWPHYLLAPMDLNLGRRTLEHDGPPQRLRYQPCCGPREPGGCIWGPPRRAVPSGPCSEFDGLLGLGPQVLRSKQEVSCDRTRAVTKLAGLPAISLPLLIPALCAYIFFHMHLRTLLYRGLIACTLADKDAYV